MRFNERSFVVLIGGGLVVAIAVAVVLFLLLGGGDDAGGDVAAAGNAASSLEGGPDEVLYLSGTSLVRRDLEEGTEDPAGTLESPNVYAAPGSHWIAYVSPKVDRGGDGEDDFVAEPVLHLYDAETEEEERYGAGVAPVWNRSGTHVAFLQPVDARNCQAESCPGDVQVGVVEAETGTEWQLLTPGTYSILGWSGEWVLVSDFADPATITAVSLDNDLKKLDVPVSQFWDASPDGRWIVKTNAKKTEFVGIEDGTLTDERVVVDLGDYQLLEGAWAHDSSRVAAVVTSESVVHKESKDKKDATDRVVTGDPTSRIVTFSPDDPEPVMVDGTFGATGTVLWSVDNESIVFASLLNPKRALFQAKTCSVGNPSGCEIVTSWTEGVVLLRTE